MPRVLSEDCQVLFDALLIEPAEFLAKLTELEDAGGFKDIAAPAPRRARGNGGTRGDESTIRTQPTPPTPT